MLIKVHAQRGWGDLGFGANRYDLHRNRDHPYCQRGEAENRIKEAQVGLFATRTSCHIMRSNQLRVLLAALGYVLIERLRALALQGTALAVAQVDTLRVKLLKVAAVVTRNTRRIRLYLASNWPSAQLFAHATPWANCELPERHTAPGRRDDTRSARNPSRGGGHCARAQRHRCANPSPGAVEHRLALLQVPIRLIGRGLRNCVKYPD